LMRDCPQLAKALLHDATILSYTSVSAPATLPGLSTACAPLQLSTSCLAVSTHMASS
jgi:hypothetical protein